MPTVEAHADAAGGARSEVRSCSGSLHFGSPCCFQRWAGLPLQAVFAVEALFVGALVAIEQMPAQIVATFVADAGPAASTEAGLEVAGLPN
jgi:hypothetical protein